MKPAFMVGNGLQVIVTYCDLLPKEFSTNYNCGKITMRYFRYYNINQRIAKKTKVCDVILPQLYSKVVPINYDHIVQFI